MKKALYVICTLLYSAALSGQQITDYILKAKALNESGFPEKSIELLSASLTNNKESRLLEERAEAYILKGDYPAAISDFNEANKINPFSGEYGLSRIYALKGDAATSLYHLELNLKSIFKKSEKEILLDPSFGPVENTTAWRQFWKKEWYSQLERSISEIEYYTSSGKTDEAMVILESLRKNYNSDNDVRYAESLVKIASGKNNEAAGILTQLLGYEPGNEKFLRTLARVQVAVSNYAGASASYSELIGSGVADAELYIQRAEAYRKTGESGKAIEDIERYLSLYPGNKKALSLAGKAEAESGDNLKALKYFSENLQLHPSDPECYTDRANSYYMAKSWEWAIKDYSMSLDLDPRNAEAWLNMGVANFSTGRTDEACHDFRKAYALGSKRASELISKNCIK